MASELYPLRFVPQLRRYIWGGRRLATQLNKPIGPDTAAESWEIADHGDTVSIVEYGPLAGTSLRQLIQNDGKALLGEAVHAAIHDDAIPDSLRGRFPLLLKFLDANANLSIQVHPDDAMGQTLDPPDLGKTEAWYVMAADPGATIYAGLKSGVDRAAFESAVAAGQTDRVMHQFQPTAGDCVFIPAGTLHAIGSGLLIAEIQQTSDTTFRVFDWNRVGADGQSRPLHIDQSIIATNFERGPVDRINAVEIAPNVAQLVSCNQFTVRRYQVDGTLELKSDTGQSETAQSDTGARKFRIVAVTQGQVTLAGDPSGKPLTIGQTALLPASVDCVTVKGTAELLEIVV